MVLPTAEYTLIVKAPSVRMIDDSAAVTNSDPLWKNQVSVLEPLIVSGPINVASGGN
jgi:hypothetical protein